MDKNALILSTSFQRNIHDYTCPFMWDYTKGLASIFENVYVLVPHSEDDNEIKKERHNNIYIKRFTYFFKNRYQYLCYRKDGIFINLKRYFLAWVQIPFFLGTYIIQALWYSRQKKVDIVYCHWLQTIIIGMFLKWFLKTRLVVILHGSDIRFMPKFLSRFLLNRADVITTGHEELYNFIILLKIKSPVKFIRNFIEEAKFHQSLHKPKTILFPARLCYEKNPLFFLKVAHAFLSIDPSIKFFIAGDGELEDDVERFIKEKKLLNTTYIGPQKNMFQKMSQYEIIFFCSRTENVSSTTLQEAIFNKKICILNDVGRANDFFQDGYNAILYKNLDLKDAVDKLKKYFQKKSSFREKIIKNAYKTLQEKGFVFKKIQEQHIKYLQDLFLNES